MLISQLFFDRVCYICTPNPKASDISHKAIFCPHHYSHRQLPSHQSQPPLHNQNRAYGQPWSLSLQIHISGLSTLAYLGN